MKEAVISTVMMRSLYGVFPMMEWQIILSLTTRGLNGLKKAIHIITCVPRETIIIKRRHTYENGFKYNTTVKKYGPLWTDTNSLVCIQARSTHRGHRGFGLSTFLACLTFDL